MKEIEQQTSSQVDFFTPTPWTEIEFPELQEKITLSLINPNGNVTALVQNTNRSPEQMATINDTIMAKKEWQVEQVGFYDVVNSQEYKLQMAGGELCVNAIRALAFLSLNGQEGSVVITAEPNIGSFEAGVTQNIQTGKIESWVTLPLPNSTPMTSEVLGYNCFQVPMKGICHLVTDQNLSQPGIDEQLNDNAVNALSESDFLDNPLYPAAGVMFYQIIDSSVVKLYPVVWVRDVRTLFAENACGSGTLATVATLLEQGQLQPLPNSPIQVIQITSGEILYVTVDQVKSTAIISGTTSYIRNQIK